MCVCMLNKMSLSNDTNKKCEFQKKLFFYIYSGCNTSIIVVLIAIRYIIEKKHRKNCQSLTKREERENEFIVLELWKLSKQPVKHLKWEELLKEMSFLVFLSTFTFSLDGVQTDLLVVLLEGGQVLSRLRELSFLHPLAHVPVDERSLRVPTTRHQHLAWELRYQGESELKTLEGRGR
jgi:hypothetical protein